MSRNFFPVVMAIGVGVTTPSNQPFNSLRLRNPPSVQSSNPAGSSDKATGAPTSGALPSATKPEAEKNQ
ncbi:hypothetical protein N7448_001392 [Penicillium atrosanguineum]|nr:hypothetical protein N7448_001392 [Penicillium atrosanguineum]